MKTKLYGITHFILLFIAFFFQSSPVIKRFEVGETVPNIVFVLLFVYALFLKDTEVVSYSVIFGTLTDLIFGKIYGITTLLLILFVCIYIFLNRYIFTESMWVVILYCFLSSILYESLLLIINTAIWNEAVISGEVFKILVTRCVYNGIVCIPVFYFARKIHRQKQEVRIDG
ncbi:MAG: rod shape-determining protein MreD [Clostridia bacterium]|nr:rod shape-determining protein MreD [Clostridia bacterium]